MGPCRLCDRDRSRVGGHGALLRRLRQSLLLRLSLRMRMDMGILTATDVFTTAMEATIRPIARLTMAMDTAVTIPPTGGRTTVMADRMSEPPTTATGKHPSFQRRPPSRRFDRFGEVRGVRRLDLRQRHADDPHDRGRHYTVDARARGSRTEAPGPLPDGTLKIVASGDRKDEAGRHGRLILHSITAAVDNRHGLFFAASRLDARKRPHAVTRRSLDPVQAGPHSQGVGTK